MAGYNPRMRLDPYITRAAGAPSPHGRPGARRPSGHRAAFARGFVIAFFLAASSGCVTLGDRAGTPAFATAAARDCVAAFDRDDATILHANVRDPQFHVVPGFPFLRVDRFLDALSDRATDTDARRTWLERMSERDTAARAGEWRNLPPADRPTPAAREVLQSCTRTLIDEIMQSPTLVRELVTAARFPDDYRVSRRVLGVYPLTAWFVRHGVRRLQARERAYFEAAARPTGADAAVRYYTLAADPERPPERPFARDPLGIPRFTATDLERLFARHAPVFAITTASEYDIPGTVRAAEHGPWIDTAFPAAYTYLTHTLFDGEALVQLNYVIWFRGRPRRGPFDLLGGRFDGITWRVTLARDGDVLIADAMHNCGCYYMAFPGDALHRRDATARLEEPLWVPQRLPPGNGRVQIDIDSAHHYIRGIRRAASDLVAENLATKPYRTLKNLDAGDGHTRSLFAANGLVTESARGERFVLWPMGVVSPGAMRVAGRHAIAFVGRRHFDDPALLDGYFAPAAGSP